MILLTLLEHNGIPYELVKSGTCCGISLPTRTDKSRNRRKKKAVNIPALADYPRAGYVLIGATPSYVLMYKSELPPMFPDDPDIHTLADAFWSPFE